MFPFADEGSLVSTKAVVATTPELRDQVPDGNLATRPAGGPHATERPGAAPGPGSEGPGHEVSEAVFNMYYGVLNIGAIVLELILIRLIFQRLEDVRDELRGLRNDLLGPPRR